MPRIPLHIIILITSLLVLVFPSDAATWRMVVNPQSGSSYFEDNGKILGNFDPGLWNGGWQWCTSVVPAPQQQGSTGSYHGQLTTKEGAIVDVTSTFVPVANGVQVEYRFVPQQDVNLDSLHVNLMLPVGKIVGGTCIAKGQQVIVPHTVKDAKLYEDIVSDVTLAFLNRKSLSFHFASPTNVLLQDNRPWMVHDVSLRIGPQGKAFPAGKPYIIAVTVTSPDGVSFVEDHPVTLAANETWIPLDSFPQDIIAGSALDLSQQFPKHAPAGKYGHVIATKNGSFAFAARPTTPVRFYGVNFVGTAQYLSHAESDQLADRLARLGYNAVRFHHHESPLIEYNGRDSVHLDPTALDQLDYLAAALKKRGIYYTTDLYVSRPVLASEIWPGETGNAGYAYKMAVLINERAYANFITFTTTLLTHVNPYTGLRWADDPALAWINLINEGNPENTTVGDYSSPRVREWDKAWQAWLASHAPEKGTLPFPTANDQSPQGKLRNRFLADTDAAFFARVKEYLRKTLHCQALLTNLNCELTFSTQTQQERRAFDYVDNHYYDGTLEFLGSPWLPPCRCGTTTSIEDGYFGSAQSAFIRFPDKPFTISEFNHPAPAHKRVPEGLLTASLAATQNWSGLWRFAYSHCREGVVQPLTLDYFNVGRDPLNQAADQMAILLFRRGDVKPASHLLAISYTPEDVKDETLTQRRITPRWDTMAFITRVGVLSSDGPGHADLALPFSGKGSATKGQPMLAIDPAAPDALAKILAEMRRRGWLTSTNRTDVEHGIWQSETGEVTMNIPANTFTVDTPRSVGGFVSAGNSLTTKVATITVDDTDATVLLSSLDSQPISKSHRLLLFHLTEVQNSGSVFTNQACTVLTDWGRLPYLVREGRATVTLRLPHPERARVWEIAPSGARVAPIATKCDAGTLIIPLDVNANGHARYCYEIEVTP